MPTLPPEGQSKEVYFSGAGPGADPYLTVTGPLNTGGATTTLAAVASLAAQGSTVFDALSAFVVVSNPAGVGQTITSGSLQLSDTIGGVTTTLTYALPGTVSIAPGANQAFVIPLTQGVLKTVALSVTFGGTPTAGTLTALLVFQGPAGAEVQGGVAGSSLPSAVGAGQRVSASYTLKGQAYVTPVSGAPGDGSTIVGFNTASDTSSVAAVAAFAFQGASWDKQRTPNVFKTAQASASGSTALWTPAAGKKFRLMRFKIDVPANCTLAARGVQVIKFFDAAADMNIATDVWLGQTAPVETASSEIPNFTTGWIDLGNGFLSATINNVLNTNLGTALAAGNVRVTCCGTEE